MRPPPSPDRREFPGRVQRRFHCPPEKIPLLHLSREYLPPNDETRHRRPALLLLEIPPPRRVPPFRGCLPSFLNVQTWRGIRAPPASSPPPARRATHARRRMWDSQSPMCRVSFQSY